MNLYGNKVECKENCVAIYIHSVPFCILCNLVSLYEGVLGHGQRGGFSFWEYKASISQGLVLTETVSIKCFSSLKFIKIADIARRTGFFHTWTNL